MPYTPTPDQPRRTVHAHLEADVTEVAEVVLSVALAGAAADTIDITLNGGALRWDVVAAPHATRLHLVRGVPAGRLVVDYRAQVIGSVPGAGPDAARDATDRVTYLRPSRYCESDALASVAADLFTGLAGKDLLDAVSSWVGQHLAYISGSSRGTDGALQTYLGRQGVCRDFAHLVVALLRARGVPARLASVYAPGLSPMDFHAVAEAQLDDGWYVVDATLLAPRTGMLRIATGRDAADTAFLTVHSGRVGLAGLSVHVLQEPWLPDDDLTALVRLV